MFFLCLQIDHHARYSPWRRTTAAISLSKVLNAMIRFYNSALSRIAYSLKIHCRAAMSTHVREYVIFQPISKAMESVKTYVLSVSWTISFTNHSIWPYLPTYCSAFVFRLYPSLPVPAFVTAPVPSFTSHLVLSVCLPVCVCMRMLYGHK